MVVCLLILIALLGTTLSYILGYAVAVLAELFTEWRDRR